MSTASDLKEAIDVQVNELIHTYTQDIIEKQLPQINKQIGIRLDEVLEQVIRSTVVDMQDQVIRSSVDNVQIDKLIHDYSQEIIRDSINAQVNKLIATYTKELVGHQVHKTQKQVRTRIDEVLEKVIRDTVDNIDFPESSIPPSSIDWTDFSISHKQVQGYRDLRSIEDFSNHVELSLLDGAVVVENSLITKEIIVDVLTVTEDISINDSSLNKIRDHVLSSIPAALEPKNYDKEISHIQEQVTANAIPSQHLKELEVSGEAMLSNVLYTTPGNRRVGINTMEPSDALTVWDNEVEVVIGKHKAQEGYVGTRRRQSLNIGANNKVGITVNGDGIVGIEKLQLMGRTISDGDMVPGHAARRGDLVLNNSVKQGDFIGWVCLDGLRWAGFGKVE